MMKVRALCCIPLVRVVGLELNYLFGQFKAPIVSHHSIYLNDCTLEQYPFAHRFNLGKPW